MDTSDCIIIPLTRGYSTVIDQIDSDLADFKWTAVEKDNRCYAIRRSGKRGGQKGIYLHMVILSRMLDRALLPSDRVDHIDGDGTNNQRQNLRLATNQQNSCNSKLNKNNTTGYKGVTRNGKGFAARIRVNYKRIALGTYATPELAAKAYDKAAIEHFGEFALTNSDIILSNKSLHKES